MTNETKNKLDICTYYPKYFNKHLLDILRPKMFLLDSSYLSRVPKFSLWGDSPNFVHSLTSIINTNKFKTV